jgi:TolA-binding protein
MSFFSLPPQRIISLPKPALTLVVLCLVTGLSGCSWEMVRQANNPDRTRDQAVAAENIQADKRQTLETRRLFTQPVQNTEQRFMRLEREVQRLRDNLDRMAPAVGRLVRMEEDLEILVDQMEEMPESQSVATTGAPPLRLDRMYTPDDQQQAATPTPATTQQAAVKRDSAVTKIRFGEHVDKTRIVLDLAGKTAFSVALHDNRMGMTVMLPHAGWAASRSWTSDIAPLVKSYQARELPHGGYQVSFTFHEPARIIRQEILPPRAHRGYGLVIDLFNSDLHAG